jgi:plasmid stabilization system protein ParE
VAALRFSRRAETDLQGIGSYTLSTWGAGQTIRYLDDLEACCRMLAKNPGMGPIPFTYKSRWWGRRSVFVVCRTPKATDHEWSVPQSEQYWAWAGRVTMSVQACAGWSAACTSCSIGRNREGF